MVEMKKYNPVNQEVIEALKAVVGAEHVFADAEQLEKYKTDEETDPRYFHTPEVAVEPANAQEVAAVMKVANKYIVPVTPRSAGTSVSCGAIAVCGGIVYDQWLATVYCGHAARHRSAAHVGGEQYRV